jgi:hypothetical protein
MDDEPKAILVKAISGIIAALIVPAGSFALIQWRIRYITRTKFGRTSILEAELDRHRTSSRMNEDGTQVLKEPDSETGEHK